MGRWGQKVSTIGIGLLLTGAGVSVSRAALPPPADHRGAEPAEELLSPVDPAWKSHGWHAVVPHAFVIRPLLAVRAKPDPKAPIVFSLKGGVRVPVVEQGRQWWKVSWTGGRTGWAPASALEPHAAFVLIDTATGRVIRRMAAKGQEGALSDGRTLWSLSNTGLTRTIPGERPQIWSYPVAGVTRDSSLPFSAAWNRDRSRLYVREWQSASAPLLTATASDGSVSLLDRSVDAQLVGPVANEQLLLRKEKQGTNRYSLWTHGKQLSLPGGDIRAAIPVPNGTMLVLRDDKLERLSASAQRIQSTRVPDESKSLCLSSDHRFVAIASPLLPVGKGTESPGTRVTILRADNFARVASLPLSKTWGDLLAVVRRKDGWTVGLQPDGGALNFLRLDNRGRQRAAWEPTLWTMDSNAGTVYLADTDGIVVVPANDSRTRRIPYRWHRPLPDWLHPGGSGESGELARRRTSSISLSPDGKTLVVTEWLTNDPEG